MTEESPAMFAVRKARARLLMGNPFFGSLAMQLRIIEWTEETVPWYIGKNRTMAVDGYNMYFWPDFVTKLSDDELMGVVAHEIMHCAYRHFSRRGDRHPQIWNIAGDYRINDDLKRANFTLPNPHLHDSKYADMGTEEIYASIFDEINKAIKSGNYEIIDDKDGCGIVLDAGSQGGKKGQPGQQPQRDPAAQDQADRDWEINVRQAASEAQRKNAGSMPGYLERLIKTLNEPVVDWRSVLRQWIDGYMNREPSWARPNRRMVHSGQYWPGHNAESINHLVGCIDVSGSINDQLLRDMVSEMAGALDGKVCDRLTIIYADDGVQHVDDFESGDTVEAKTTGHGGTCFNATYEHIKRNYPEATCIVYLTDMETSSFGEDLGIPTLWAAYNDRARLEQLKPPFGSVIHIANG